MTAARPARRLLHLGVPPRREALKDTLGPAMPLGGAQVAESAMVTALLRHRPFDEICFIPAGTASPAQTRDLVAEYGGDPASVLSPGEIADLPGRTLIFQNSPRLFEAAGLRRRFGRPDWPVVGVTHSLSIADGTLAALFGVLPSGFVAPFDRLICTSRAGQRAFGELQRAARASAGTGQPDLPGRELRTAVIPLGVDTGHFKPDRTAAARSRLGIGPAETVFLYCGRFSAEYKMDPFPLLAAFATALRERPGVRLILAGDSAGGAHTGIPAAAAALGVGDRVSVIPDPTAAVKLALYQAADVFVSFSDNLQETFGLSVIEAMSCALPVIATDWSGLRETVADGETGFLVPTSWYLPQASSAGESAFVSEAAAHLGFARQATLDMGSAVAAMRRLADSPPLRRDFGERGRRRVLTRYAWPVVMAAYGDLFGSLLDEAAGAESGAGRGGYPPFGYDHLAVFGHYATRVTGLPEVVERTGDERSLLAAAGFSAAIGPVVAGALTGRLPPGRAARTRDLIGALTVAAGDRRAAVTAVQLLLKYGVLTAVAPPAPAAPAAPGPR